MISSVNFLPHGMQIIPSLDKEKIPLFTIIDDSMSEVTSLLEKENPEIVILFTPHGYNLRDSFVVYLHNEFEGFYYEISPEESVVHGKYKFKKSWHGDLQLSTNLLEHFQSSGVAVEGLIQGFSDYPLQLAWGETVPLYYFSNQENQKIIIVGIPRSRHEKINELQADLNKLVESLLKFVDNLDKTVCLIFSGDLSHTHVKDGPYGYHKSAKIFDNLVVQWAENQSQSNFDEILEHQPTALACGMVGMYMIHTLFHKMKLKSELITYNLPTYFGMMVARWLPV